MNFRINYMNFCAEVDLRIAGNSCLHLNIYLYLEIYDQPHSIKMMTRSTQDIVQQMAAESS